MWFPKKQFRFVLIWLSTIFALGFLGFSILVLIDRIIPLHVSRTHYKTGKLKSIYRQHAFSSHHTIWGQVYYPNGTLKLEMNYKDGDLHGPYRLYSDQGKLLFQAIFVYGKAKGQIFDNKGNLIGSVSFDKKLQKGNFWQTWPSPPENSNEALGYAVFGVASRHGRKNEKSRFELTG